MRSVSLRLVVIVALAASVGATVAGAQDPEPVRATADGVLIDFQDADLRVVVTALAEAGGINLTHGELPARRVTLRMRQPIPRENIAALLRSLAQSNGLRVVDDGGFLRLEVPTAGETAIAQPDTTPPDEMRLFVYRLRHARAAKLGATLQALFGGSGGQSESRQPEGSLSDRLREERLPAAAADNAAPQVEVSVGEVRTGLPGQLRGSVQIVPDEATNSLLVRALTADWETLESAIKALDLRPLQVLIEVLILEVRRTRDFDLSISGKVADSETDPQVRGTLSGRSDGNVLFELLRAGGVDLKAAISVLSTRGDVRIVSRPVVLAQNNQEAKILIGSERPFVQVFRSLPTDAGVRDQIVQYRDVGTKLTIVPTINDDGYVNLQVLQEVSTATAETQFGAPVISTREASTQLFVRDGQTAVIGGLIDRQQEKTRSGIPLLMEIPVLGALFGSTRNTTTHSELFLFLTPHVIADDDDTDRTREGVERLSPMQSDSTAVPGSVIAVPADSAKP